ncbi:MAG: ABC transporter substrate-binding protein [Thermostichales cyanobacterium DRC_bins_46]
MQRRQLFSLISASLSTWWIGQAKAQTTPARVVALTTLSADLIYRLAPSTLIGIPNATLLDRDPRFAQLPRVGLGNVPNLEQIVALKPDWVVGASGFHTTLAERLQTFGIPSYLTRVNRWQDLGEMIRILASTLKVDPAALLAAYSRVEPQSLPSPAPKTLLLVGTQPLLSPNQDSWAGDVLRRWGAENVTATLQSQGQFRGYVTLAPEKVLQINPEIILLVNPEATDPQAYFQSRPFWRQLQAVHNQRVHIFDYYGIVNPGSWEKILAAVAKLSQVLNSWQL